MNSNDLRGLFRETLGSTSPTVEEFEALADAIRSAYNDDPRFREHIANRTKRVTETTGQAFDPENFDIATARAYLADEIGFPSWDSLVGALEDRGSDPYPMLFRYAIAALFRGDFTALEEAVGSGAFSDTIIEWYEKGYYAGETETLNETFAAACMLGHDRAADFLLEKGVDPYAGMRTGLAGFHWAASSGRLEIIKLLTKRRVPMEVENMYGGTVLGQALWSARFEHTPDHAEIIKLLIDAGAHVWPGTAEWWEEQDVPSIETKRRVAESLRRT